MNPTTANPSRIGKYEVEGTIGRGGMGVVYRALDPQLGRPVAIKMILGGGDPELLTRFIQEAKSTGRLQSPNIVTVYDFGEQDGNPYLVMEYIEGTSLEALIKNEAPLTLAEKLGIIIDVCNGLSYAHEQGVIHRDMKPANVMVLKKDGTAKIVDFGIARIGGSRLTRTDQVIGSVDYMSPEQLQNKNLDHRTDIFSTGVVLYQLLTRALPFHGNETAATLYKIVYEPASPLDVAEFPPELQSILNRALTKSANDRYETARDMALDLIQVQDRQKQATVAQYLRRAESAMQRSEWTKAGEQLQLVLRIDRQNTTARRLNTEVQDRLRQLQRAEQARHLRSQADQAMLESRYDDALHLVTQALALDEGNAELQAFRDSVVAAKQRATRLQQALRRAELAQQEGDIDEAVRAVDEALTIDPTDTQARALQVILRKQAEEKSRQDKVRQVLEQARGHIAARELTKALDALKIAEAIDPNSTELATVAKLALAAREQEKRRKEVEQLRRLIEEDLVREDYAGAIAKAEEGLRKSPTDQGLLKLKTLAEQQQRRAEQKAYVQEQCKAASRLVDAGKAVDALALIEQALGRMPGSTELEGLRETIKQRLSSDSGVRQIEELRLERRRAVAEELDRQLAREASPDVQVPIAQEALRKDAGNEFLRQRVSSLLEAQRRFAGNVESAQKAELAGNYPEAIREWQRLKGEWPQYPKADAEIQRITKLARAPKPPEKVKPRVEPPPAPPPPPPSARHGSATTLFTAVPTPQAPPVEAPVESVRKRGTRERPVEPPPPPRPEPPASKKLPILAIAAGIVVLAVVIYLVWPKTTTIKVRVESDPTGSTVSAGGKSCQTPCELDLNPGEYEVRATHDDYEPSTQKVNVTSQTGTLPIIALQKSSPPPPPPAQPGAGNLSVRANVDDVSVFVDGTFVGQTGRSAKVFSEPAGGHEVRVEKPNYEVETPAQQVTIEKDRQANLPEFKLKASTIPAQPAAVTDFRASVASIPQGQSAELSWKTKNATQVEIDNGIGRVSGSGKKQVAPRSTTTYTLRAKSAAGSAERQVKIEVVPTQPKPLPLTIDRFEAERDTIDPGQNTKLNWQTQNATQVMIEPLGTVGPSGPLTVNPSKTTTYTLTARNASESKTAQVTVTVKNTSPPPPPIINRFQAERVTIEPGQSTKLNWQTQNATQVSIEGLGSVATSGSQEVSPNKTTTYTLTAQSPGVSAIAQVTVTVSSKGGPTLHDADLEGMKAAIEAYAEAYGTLSIDEVKKAWPSIPKKTEKEMKESFRLFKAMKLRFEYGTPSFPSDTAQWPCTQLMSDTTIDGKRETQPGRPITFFLRKSGGTWRVEDIRGR